MLGDDAQVALKMKTLNPWGNSGTILFTRQTATNPSPEKRVSRRWIGTSQRFLGL